MFCEEFEITSLVFDIEDMNTLFKNFNPTLGRAFQEKSFSQCRCINSIELIRTKVFDPKDWKFGFCQVNTTTTNAERLEKGLKSANYGVVYTFFKELKHKLYGKTKNQQEVQTI